MASTYPRGNVQWAKYFHPVTFEPLRDSLETTDPARAALLCRRLELEIELARPEIRSVELPLKIRERIGIAVAVPASAQPGQSETAPHIEAPVATVKTAVRNAPVPEAIKRYHRFIVADNDAHHVAVKLSILRAFFGTAAVTEALGVGCRNVVEGFYLHPTVAEISSTLLQDFFDQLKCADSTKRHYREVLHHFVEKMIDFEIYTPPNVYRPNPVATLPTYGDGDPIVTFLTAEDIVAQRAALAGNDSILMAVDIMIEAGLRRDEALGVRVQDIRCEFRAVGGELNCIANWGHTLGQRDRR